MEAKAKEAEVAIKVAGAMGTEGKRRSMGAEVLVVGEINFRTGLPKLKFKEVALKSSCTQTTSNSPSIIRASTRRKYSSTPLTSAQTSQATILKL
jgi:hypothetical protein